MAPDFSGWASKANLLCADGLTLLSHAFKGNDKQKVPLVWQHMYNDPENILGHAILESRPEGTYARAYFNDTPKAQAAKAQVMHGDITQLSIYANQLVKQGNNVKHGVIREVSLVIAGANPGANIDFINLQHGDGSIEQLDNEAIITTGEFISHADTPTPNEPKEAPVAEEKTVKDVYDAMTDEQKDVLHYMIGAAVEEADGGDDEETAEQAEVRQAAFLSDISEAIIKHIKEDPEMTHTVFDQNNKQDAKNELSHDQMKEIFADAAKTGSLKESFISHAATYGFDKIDTLFPDAKLIGDKPELVGRRVEWVNKVLSGAKHSPFSRVRTVVADITADEARAKGYVKGNKKKDEIVKLLKRKTGPTTIYKKQKLDRDDILDITEFDTIVWLKGEMRVMLDEEIARAVLLGDGRDADDEDKVDEDSIKPIAFDDDFYAVKVELANGITAEDELEQLLYARSEYRGTGSPTYYTTLKALTRLLLHKDKMGRRIYDSVSALASALMVPEIVTVEVMEEYSEIAGIFVNLSDYTIGTDKGGDVSFFDDFDIDYNQFKYLLETRMSGMLTKPRSAIVIRRARGTLASPVAPSFDGATNTITIPTTTGVDYKINGIVVTGTKVIKNGTTVTADPKANYSFANGADDNWYYAYTPAAE